MDTNPFLEQWDRQFAEWCADDLMRDGQEAALLLPVARHRWAAAALVEHAAQSDDHRRRKAAAILAGLIPDAPGGLLDELFEQESERAALADPETTEPLCCQSVVEDIVLAAARWSLAPATRDGGISLLRKVVERTLIGEYWSSAAYAMAALCRSDPEGSAGLLRAFAGFAQGTPPAHPTNPSLATEREFARSLLGGHGEAIEAVQAMLDNQRSAADTTQFDAETQAAVERWLDLAKQLG